MHGFGLDFLPIRTVFFSFVVARSFSQRSVGSTTASKSCGRTLGLRTGPHWGRYRLTNDAVKGRFRATIRARCREKRNNTAGGIRRSTIKRILDTSMMEPKKELRYRDCQYQDFNPIKHHHDASKFFAREILRSIRHLSDPITATFH